MVKLETWTRYTHWNIPVYEETNYTGRWKIVKVNDCSELFIECFEIEEVEYEESFPIEKVGYYFKHWWQDTFGAVPEEYIYFELCTEKKTKPHAVVQWVSEHNLRITQREEFINTCSGDCE